MRSMTSAEAKTFSGLSVTNYLSIKSQLKCQCEPYDSVFTYARWTAQGYQVQRGEKGIKIATMIPITRERADGEVVTSSRPWTAVVFCKCQVKGK